MGIMRKSVVCAFASAALVQATPITYTWKDCGSSTTHSHVTGLTSQPASPTLGQPVTFTGTGTSDEAIVKGDSAQYTLTAKNSWGIQLFTHTDTICGPSSFNLPLGMGTIDVSGVNCPAPKGAMSLSQKMTLPSSMPFKKITMTMTAKDAAGQDLLCMTVNVNVGSEEETEEELSLTPDVMPVLDYSKDVQATRVTGTPTPVVVMHGMGDSGSNPGMQSLCKSITQRYPGTYVKCLDVADGLSSITTKLDKQLDTFTQQITSDAQLKNGFNAVGLSQGNLLIRAYIERTNSPKVGTFISMDGPMNGVATCPNNFLYKMICPLWKIAPYSAPIAFSDYWKDPSDQATYLKKSRFLADINNEQTTKNPKYKANIAALDKYVLVEAMEDSMVQPHQSEQHGYYAWGSTSTLEELEQTQAYKEDWLGLKTLDDAKKLTKLSYQGDHMRWGSAFWSNTILPYLAPKAESETVVV